jgi:hypothetical protein
MNQPILVGAVPYDPRVRVIWNIFAMCYHDPKHREMMDMEGLKAWVRAAPVATRCCRRPWQPSMSSTRNRSETSLFRGR